jgi:hypothetical protein
MINDFLVTMTLLNYIGEVSYRHFSGSGVYWGGEWFQARLKHPGIMTNALFDGGRTSGQSKIGYGSITLTNPDGQLDYLLGYGIDGQTVTIQEWDVVTGTKWTLQFVMELPVFSNTEVEIRIKDPQFKTDVPLQTQKYLGNNAEPDGLEGSIELKGKNKPLIYGTCKNITPILVNKSKLIYEFAQNTGIGINAGAVINSVKDKGVPILQGESVNMTELMSKEPVPGYYNYTANYVRLSNTPIGVVTMDVTSNGTGTYTGTADCVYEILSNIVGASISGTDLTQLGTDNGATVGLYVTEDMTIKTAVDKLMSSIGGWWGVNPLVGNYRLGILKDVSADTPYISLNANSILDVQKVVNNDEGRGLPCWSVTINHSRNYTKQDPSTLGAVGMEEKNFDAYGTYIGVYGNGMFMLITGTTVYSSVVDGGLTLLSTAAPFTPRAIAYGGDRFVIINTNSVAYSINNGVSWVVTALPGSFVWDNLVFNGMYFIASAPGTSNLYFSGTGTYTSWNTTTSSGNWSKIAHNEGTYAIILETGTNRYAYSSNYGATWSIRTLPTGTSWVSVCYGNGMFIAHESSGTIAISKDNGLTWTSTTVSSLNTYTRMYFYDGTFYAMATTNPSKTYAISSDGVSWEFITLTNYNSNYMFSGGPFGLIMSSYGPYGSRSFRTTPDLAIIALLGMEYQTAVKTSPTVQIMHPMAPALTFDSCFVDGTSAELEATRQLTLRSNSNTYTVRAHRSALGSLFPTMGKDVIYINFNRFYMTKNYTLIGISFDFSSDEVTFTVWG